MDKWSPVALFCARVRVSDITVMSWRNKWWPGFSVSEVVVVTVVPAHLVWCRHPGVSGHLGTAALG